ncbi:NADPH-dependent FMN reductase [Billgrantia sp. LNSP4103-1]|uniref:NADPH-dependent FMN reductase n=1 Tax=Billgrantia sp. LNSP4103-1 TaxID=3410266 RepID=UPI00403F53F8
MPHFLVFLGSARDSTPPAPARLGLRVALACVALLRESGHEVELIDPLDIELAPTFKPHFAYGKSKVPQQLAVLAEKIERADGYVMVSPEYNHSMSPALSHLLNHFGSSLFAFKPSAIVTYSAGQWGGARAAVAMRTFLAELGCLPVSAMVHVPRAQDALDADGNFPDDAERWNGYFGRTLGQLEWWSEAAARQRELKDPNRVSPAFARDPSQRNAPSAD